MLLRVPSGLYLKKILRSACTVYLCALYGSEAKHQFSVLRGIHCRPEQTRAPNAILWRTPQSRCAEKKQNERFGVLT